MKEPQVKSIRALARGLEVLQLLQRSGALTLHGLHGRTGIPKASLLRILKTLKAQGLVWQRMADDAYAPSFTLADLAARMSREQELVEVASPLLGELSDAIRWPSVLAVPRLTHMEVIETNASRAYVGGIALGPVGFRVNMLRSASGRAFVAFCEAPVRTAILETLARSPHPGDRLAQRPEYVEQAIAETRAQGFGLRDPDFGGDFDADRARVDDGRDSLGVAIRLGAHVAGTINITWTRRALSRERAIAQLAPAVIRTAERIAERYGRPDDFTG